MKATTNTNNVLGVVEHPNGKTYQISYLDDNAPGRQFVVTDASSGRRLGGFESFKKAEIAARNRDRTLEDDNETGLEIYEATQEEIQKAMSKIFPRSEITRRLQELDIGAGIKIKGELKKIRTAVYSFAQTSKRKFTVRPSETENEWLVIRVL